MLKFSENVKLLKCSYVLLKTPWPPPATWFFCQIEQKFSSLVVVLFSCAPIDMKMGPYSTLLHTV